MTTLWNKWDEQKPSDGDKVIIVCSDYCSSAPAFIAEGGVALHAEDGSDLGWSFLSGSIWAKLPADWPIAFMEITEEDWR